VSRIDDLLGCFISLRILSRLPLISRNSRRGLFWAVVRDPSHAHLAMLLLVTNPQYPVRIRDERMLVRDPVLPWYRLKPFIVTLRQKEGANGDPFYKSGQQVHSSLVEMKALSNRYA
jgi:hypothetical protein